MKQAEALARTPDDQKQLSRVRDEISEFRDILGI
jgi:hypothetical protein